MTDSKILAVIATFPAKFGLRAYPGQVFRISEQNSYVNDYGVVYLYTQVQGDFSGTVSWTDFAKGTPDELQAEIVDIPHTVSLSCDKRKDCIKPVTMMDKKGWLYCSEHGPYMLADRPVRKLRQWEIRMLLAGGTLYYRPENKQQCEVRNGIKLD